MHIYLGLPMKYMCVYIMFSLAEFLVVYISYFKTVNDSRIFCLTTEHDSDTLLIQAVFHPFLSFLCYSLASGSIVYIVLHSLAV